jgi:Aldolase/RraA
MHIYVQRHYDKCGEIDPWTLKDITRRRLFSHALVSVKRITFLETSLEVKESHDKAPPEPSLEFKAAFVHLKLLSGLIYAIRSSKSSRLPAMPQHLKFMRATATCFRAPSIAKCRRTMSSSLQCSPKALEILRKYGACDISDALLKLKVPGAGFLPDLIQYCDQLSHDTCKPQPILVAPASTVLFIPKNDSGSAYPPSNIPAGEHWVDLTQPGTIAILSQPEGQKNAVLGGIMALRMKKLSALGVVVHGRIRDMEELKASELMVCQCLVFFLVNNLD